MHHFLYVFSEEERDTLLSHGYVLLKEDEQRKIYLFENKETQVFDAYDVNAVPSDIITF